MSGIHPLRVSLDGHRGRVIVQLRYQISLKTAALSGVDFVEWLYRAEFLPEVIASLEEIKARMLESNGGDTAGQSS